MTLPWTVGAPWPCWTACAPSFPICPKTRICCTRPKSNQANITAKTACREERGIIVDAVLQAGRGRDLVGFYAAGGIHTGFANSFGQRNWFSTYTYNIDWSFYLKGDKAVKTADAGFVRKSERFPAQGRYCGPTTGRALKAGQNHPAGPLPGVSRARGRE